MIAAPSYAAHLPVSVLNAEGKSIPRTLAVADLVIAGWTGRDAAAVEAHIAELEALGIQRPPSTPVFYRAASRRLTVADTIEVIGSASGGEAECVLFAAVDELLAGIGSDHTDRAAEVHGITLSKQMCDKPIGPMFWRFEDIEPHWDALQLRSWTDGVAYQDGTLAAMRHPRDLIAQHGGLQPGTLMFCGTLPAIGGVRPTGKFRMELHDPVRNRTLCHEYATRVLPE
jgi:2-keto-4-pentenoate hydratase/2-oxohepta-3-ene-1,7-dioic acid hydratase in catechol pathway